MYWVSIADVRCVPGKLLTVLLKELNLGSGAKTGLSQNRRCLENSAKTAPASTANASDQVIVEKVNHLRLLKTQY